MRKYASLFRVRFAMGLQYRTAALAGMATQLFWGVMEILLYRAFYADHAAAFPMTFEATVNYIWLQQALLVVFAAWLLDPDILSSIASGDVAYTLCRPVKIYDLWFAQSAAGRLASAMLRCVPIVAVALLLPKPYGMSLPPSAGQFALFGTALALSFGVSVAFYMLIYVVTVYTVSPSGVRLIVGSVVEFLSGGGIPLPFFPDGVRAFLEMLPFAAMQNVPLRVYSGSMTPAQTRRAMGLQVFWLIALVLLGRVLCARVQRRMTVQGG